MSKRRIRVGLVFALLLVTACGGRARLGSAPQGDEQEEKVKHWAGFARIAGLGGDCTASAATNASKHYSPLTWLPCASGATGCEEMKWDGVLRWDPTGSGDMLEFHARLALNRFGNAERLAVVRTQPRGSGHQAIPFEAVVFDLNSRVPLVAIRSVGDASSDPNVTAFGGTECELEPVPTHNGVWLVGKPSQQTMMVAGRIDYGDPSPISLRTIDATDDVLDTTIAATDSVLGLEHADGRIAWIGSEARLDGSAYGPSTRVWLQEALESDLIVSEAQFGGAPQFFRLEPSGQFLPLAVRGNFPRFDGSLATSIEFGVSELAVLAAPFSREVAPTVTMKEVARIPREDFVDASLGDGVLALVSGTDHSTTSNVTAVLIPLRGGPAARRDLRHPPAPTEEIVLVGNDARHVYFTETTAQDSRLVRYRLTP